MRPHDGEIAARDANRRSLKQEISKFDGSHRGEDRTPTLGGAIATVVRGIQLCSVRMLGVFIEDLETASICALR